MGKNITPCLTFKAVLKGYDNFRPSVKHASVAKKFLFGKRNMLFIEEKILSQLTRLPISLFVNFDKGETEVKLYFLYAPAYLELTQLGRVSG